MTLLFRRVTTGGLSLLIVLPVGAAPVAARTGEPPCFYDVTVLDLIPDCGFGGEPGSIGPRAIADNGWITGHYPQCDFDAGSWVALSTDGQSAEGLIPPYAGVWNAEGTGISSTGRIVGTMDISGEGKRGLVFDHVSEQWELVEPDPGYTFIELDAVNATGTAVGTTGNVVVGPSPLAITYENGNLTDLWALLPSSKSEARDINDAGIVIGWHGSSASTDARAFVLDHGSLTTLDVIPGGYTSEGIAINEHNDVLVYGRVSDPTHGYVRRGYIHRDGEYIPLGILPGFIHMIPQALSYDGTVVGWCQSTASSLNAREAFIWRNGVLSTLDSFIDPSLDLDAQYALSINRYGDITAIGTDSSPVGAFAFVLRRPIDTDLNHDCVTDIADLMLVLSNWGQSSAFPDPNRDGLVNVLDLLLVLGNWG